MGYLLLLFSSAAWCLFRVVGLVSTSVCVFWLAAARLVSGLTHGSGPNQVNLTKQQRPCKLQRKNPSPCKTPVFTSFAALRELLALLLRWRLVLLLLLVLVAV